MASFEYKYDNKQRWEQIVNSFDQYMNVRQSNKIFGEIAYEHIELDEDLFIFETQLIKLEKEIRDLKTDGTENRFLKFDNECDKITQALDKMVNLEESKRNKKKRMLQTLIDYSSTINSRSIANLESLIKKLRIKGNKAKDIYEAENFLNLNTSSTIKAIDDYRYRLAYI